MTIKIAILGAGIGGLTVAHELANSASTDYEIHVYERQAVIGGMARSACKQYGEQRLPTEYCWRIYGPNYDNLREILKQIPLIDNPSKTVHDNLIDIPEYLIADQDRVFTMNNQPKTLMNLRLAFKKVPFRQKMDVLTKILYCFMISDQRLNAMDRMSWKEYIDPDDKLCPDMRKYIIDIMGPYLGAEPLKVNVPSVVKTLESFKLLNRPLSVMNGPTSEAWFTHWKAWLERHGVIFHFDTEVIDLCGSSTDIDYALLSNGDKIKADVFFCSLPIERAAKLDSLTMPNLKPLAQQARQLMVSMQLYFDKKIQLPADKTAMYIPDSPWQLVIEPQGALWKKSYGDIADLWSIGLCDPVRPGLLIKKPFIQCTPEEIKTEVWHQITSSGFGSLLNLQSVKIIDYNLWDSYVFNGTGLETDEPKFSTNKGTWFLRPDNKTPYNNLHFATGYTKTDTDMFEMESAAESGKRAAKRIEKKVKVYKCNRPLFFSIYRGIDSLIPGINLYNKGSPFLWFIPGLVLLIGLPLVYLKNCLRK